VYIIFLGREKTAHIHFYAADMIKERTWEQCGRKAFVSAAAWE